MQSLRRALKRAVNSTDNIAAELTQDEQNEHSTKRLKGNSSASQSVGGTDKYSEIFDAVLSQVRGGPATSETCSDTQPEDAIEYSRHDELFVRMLDCQRQLMDAMNAKLDDVLSFHLTDSADRFPSLTTRATEVTGKSDSTHPTALPVRSVNHTTEQPRTRGQAIAHSHNNRRSNNSNNRHFVHSAVRNDVDVNASEGDSGEDPDAHTTMIIHRTLRDTARRRCNVIVSGLPEEQNIEDDRKSFLGVCEEWLPMKPTLSEGSCVRIGRSQPGVPRRLLVRTGSEETATALLKVAPLLRQADDVDVSLHVFINPDLAPEAARLAYEQRQNRRAARQQHRDAPRTRTVTNLSNQADRLRPPTASLSSSHRVHTEKNSLHVENSNLHSVRQKDIILNNENQSAVDIMSGQLSLMDDSSSVIPNESGNIHLRYIVPTSSIPVAPASSSKPAAEVDEATTVTIIADVHRPQNSEVQSLPSGPTQDQDIASPSMAAVESP